MNPNTSSPSEVLIEATIDNCRFAWPLSGYELQELFPSYLDLGSVWGEFLEYLDTSDLDWDKCDFTVEPSLQGVTYGVKASVRIPLAKGIRKEKYKEKDKDEVDSDIEMLSDSLASALEDVAESWGMNHPALEDVYPDVSVNRVGRWIKVTVEVPKALREWSEPISSLKEAITSECNLSAVPPHVRELLDVSGDVVAWEDLDITDASDDDGICYSATARVRIPLKGTLDEDGREALRGALGDCYGSLLADFEGLEYQCNDGGSVTVEVEEEFDWSELLGEDDDIDA